MSQTPGQAPHGAAIIDLHSWRAGLVGGNAVIDQAEALRRQRVAVLSSKAKAAGFAIGDKVKHPETGEPGVLVEVLPSGMAVLQFRGARLAVTPRQLAAMVWGEAGDVQLPADCEPEAAS